MARGHMTMPAVASNKRLNSLTLEAQLVYLIDEWRGAGLVAVTGPTISLQYANVWK